MFPVIPWNPAINLFCKYNPLVLFNMHYMQWLNRTAQGLKKRRAVRSTDLDHHYNPAIPTVATRSSDTEGMLQISPSRYFINWGYLTWLLRNLQLFFLKQLFWKIAVGLDTSLLQNNCAGFKDFYRFFSKYSFSLSITPSFGTWAYKPPARFSPTLFFSFKNISSLLELSLYIYFIFLYTTSAFHLLCNFSWKIK